MLASSLRSVGASVVLSIEHVVFQLVRGFRRRRTLALRPAPSTPHVVLPPPITWFLPRDPDGPPN